MAPFGVQQGCHCRMGWSHKVSAGFPTNLHFVQTLQVVLHYAEVHYAEVQSNITACCMHLHWSSLTIQYMHSARDAWLLWC